MDDGALRTIEVKPGARTAIRLLGWLLSLVAIVFFARLVLRHGVTFHGHSAWQATSVILGGAVFYGLMVSLLAFIWSYLALSSQDHRHGLLSLGASYLKSQFAKYLPGNVFQYAARHALGRQLGVTHGNLAAAAILEGILLICAAALIVLLSGQDMARSLFSSLPVVPAWSAIFIVLGVVSLSWLPRPRMLQWFPRYSPGNLLCAFLGYLLFFAGFAAIFLFLLEWLTGLTYPTTRVLSSSSLAWLVGFVIPGAPAGTGMREAALALAAGEQTPTAGLLSAIVIFRVITLLGDFLAFCAGLLISARLNKTS